MKAFMQIDDPELRRAVVVVFERIARSMATPKPPA